MPVMEETFYTAEEIAAILKVTESTVTKWLRTKKLRGFKLGSGEWRVRKTNLDAFIEERENQQNEQ